MLKFILAASVSLPCLAAFSGTASAYLDGTCTGVHREGPFLVASCRNAFGGYVVSRIDAETCPPRHIGNNNGQLTCYAPTDDAAEYYGPPRRFRYGY